MQKQYNDLIKRIKKLDFNLNQAIAAKQILSAGSNEKLSKSMFGAPEAKVGMFLVYAASNELVLCLRRVLEPAHRDRCSFKQLIKIRENTELSEFISKNIQHDNFIPIEFIKEEYSRIETIYESIIWDLKDYRDKNLGHSLYTSQKPDFQVDEGILYTDMYMLLDELSLLFKSFTRMTKKKSFNNQSRNDNWNEYADVFWSSLVNGME